MKKIAAIFVFALVTPAVFAAPGQSLRAHDGPTSVGVTRSDHGYDRGNGRMAREYAEGNYTTRSSARPSSVSTGGAAADRAAVAAARSGSGHAPGPLPVTPAHDESITIEFPRDLNPKPKAAKPVQSGLTNAEKERLREDAENQRWIEKEARAAKIIDRNHKPGEVKEALELWGKAPVGNDNGIPEPYKAPRTFQELEQSVKYNR